MRHRVTYLTLTGAHAAEDWPTEGTALLCFERVGRRDDVVARALFRQIGGEWTMVAFETRNVQVAG